MMHYSLFCVPAIKNKRKVVLDIYNQDLFYQGFLYSNNIKRYNYPVLAKSQTTKKSYK